MRLLLVIFSRLTVRMEWWRMTVAVLACAGPLPSLAVFDRSRLSYALLLSRKSSISRAIFARILKRDFGKDAANDLEIAEMAIRLGNPSLGTRLLLKVSQRDRGTAGAIAATMYRYMNQVLDGTVSAAFHQQMDALGLESGSRVTVITLSDQY